MGPRFQPARICPPKKYFIFCSSRYHKPFSGRTFSKKNNTSTHRYHTVTDRVGEHTSPDLSWSPAEYRFCFFRTFSKNDKISKKWEMKKHFLIFGNFSIFYKKQHFPFFLKILAFLENVFFIKNAKNTKNKMGKWAYIALSDRAQIWQGASSSNPLGWVKNWERSEKSLWVTIAHEVGKTWNSRISPIFFTRFQLRWYTIIERS